jgi:hypothetical protein
LEISKSNNFQLSEVPLTVDLAQRTMGLTCKDAASGDRAICSSVL